MLTKTQIEIMKVFVSEITEKFSIKQISETIKKPYPLVHRSIKELIKNTFITKDKKNLLSLNYKENISELVYVEAIRKKDVLERNKSLSLFIKDVLERIDLDFFVFLVFGSAAKSRKYKDIDVLFIIEDKGRIEQIERFLSNVLSNFIIRAHINVISKESVYEMLNKRDILNVMNETLNKHIIIFGGENYYKILKNAR